MNIQKVPHVVIIGAGFGGLQAAQKLAGAPVRITPADAPTPAAAATTS